MTILQDIKRISEQLDRKPKETVSDDAVTAAISRMANLHGYRPSPQIIEPVRAYLSGYGLLITGKPGRGKTFLMRALGVRVYTAEHIAKYGLRNIATFHEWTDGREICIDDLGTEPLSTEFGAVDDVMKSVIAWRECRQSGRTHVTTNLDAKAIADRYGDRTLSRLLGMCQAFTLTGGDMREPSPHRDQRPA